MTAALRAGVTVLGNLSVDHVDDAPPSPGGCPSFAAAVLDGEPGANRVVARCAPGDLPLFADVVARGRVDVLPSATTAEFTLRYDGEHRTLTVASTGPSWAPQDVHAAQVATTWVHCAPLLRDDFPAATIRALCDAGHRVSFDGQGLVRRRRTGVVATDGDLDPHLLDGLQVLKLSDDEALALTGGEFTREHAQQLHVPELLLTRGIDGLELYADGTVTHVPAAERVEGVQTTGAGDMFMVVYGARRAAGSPPVSAARHASAVVAARLRERAAGA